MIVLGIDPGSLRTGWGVVRQDGSRFLLLEAGVLRPTAHAPVPVRLRSLQVGLVAVIDRWQPDVVSMESVFHGVNSRSLVMLGQARGALLAAVGERVSACVELAPAQIKKALTGRGAAGKEQVARMVTAMLGASASGLPLDATDALAAAIAALHRMPASPGEKHSAKDFSGKGGGGFYAR